MYLVAVTFPLIFKACYTKITLLLSMCINAQVDFLEELPAMDTAEMEDLYRHFLVDEMPEVSKSWS